MPEALIPGLCTCGSPLVEWCRHDGESCIQCTECGERTEYLLETGLVWRAWEDRCGRGRLVPLSPALKLVAQRCQRWLPEIRGKLRKYLEEMYA